MALRKSSFIKNYKRKAVSSNLNNLHDAIRYAFILTDKYGIVKIDRAISEASSKYNIDEDTLRSTINNDDFIIENLSLMKGTTTWVI